MLSRAIEVHSRPHCPISHSFGLVILRNANAQHHGIPKEQPLMSFFTLVLGPAIMPGLIGIKLLDEEDERPTKLVNQLSTSTKALKWRARCIQMERSPPEKNDFLTNAR